MTAVSHPQAQPRGGEKKGGEDAVLQSQTTTGKNNVPTAKSEDDDDEKADVVADNDSTTYQELITFLSSSRMDLRKAAVEATLASLTSTKNYDDVQSAAKHLTTHNAIEPLCRIASMACNADVKSNEALAALAILCSHPQVGDQNIHDFINNCRGIGRMLEIALSNPPPMPTSSSSTRLLSTSISSKMAVEYNEWRERVNYACALLANAVRTEQGAVDFVGRSFPEEAIPSSSSVKMGKATDDAETSYNTTNDTKPTATLLLSRFLNSAYIQTSSPGYKLAMEAWNNPKLRTKNHKKQPRKNVSSYTDIDLDEYDSDLDINQDKDKLVDKGIDDDDLQSSIDKGSATSAIEGLVEYYDPYQHVAAIIMNITQLEKGRDFLMKLTSCSTSGSTGVRHNNIISSANTKGEEDSQNNNKDASYAMDKITRTEKTVTTSHLQTLLPQLTSPNPARRRGIAGAIKNCCFSQDSIWWLLNVVHVDKALLMTLAGPEELTIDEKVGLDPDYWLLGPQKHREPDALVRLYVAEAILLLLSSGGRRARETLRERRTYIIIKLADMVEEDEEVSERLLECVQYLRRDEEGTEEGSSDRRAYEKYARGMVEMDGLKNSKAKVGSTLPPSVGSSYSANIENEDYEDVD